MLDWGELLANWKPRDPFNPKIKGIREVYETKYEIAKRFNPKRIGEIGVRAGYSALAFLQACHTATYVGFDANLAEHGGIVGAIDWARRVLEPYDALVLLLDTQQVHTLPTTFDSFDFMHVDGAHDYKSAYHDIALATKAAPIVLVDDYDFLPDVRRAVDSFLSDHPSLRSEYVSDGGYRGNMLIING